MAQKLFLVADDRAKEHGFPTGTVVCVACGEWIKKSFGAAYGVLKFGDIPLDGFLTGDGLPAGCARCGLTGGGPSSGNVPEA